MASIYKTLAQNAPAATTPTDAYVVPAATSAVISTITVCNQATTSTVYRLWVALAGAATAAKQYVAYDTPLAGNSTQTLTLGMTLATTDVVRVYSANGSVSFNLFGVEMT